MENNPEKLKVKYVRSKDFKVIPVTGAAGSITPNGEVACNLYVEQATLPDELELYIDTVTKKRIEEKETKREHKIIRDIEIGLILNASTARAIGAWLIQRGEEADRRKGAKDATN